MKKLIAYVLSISMLSVLFCGNAYAASANREMEAERLRLHDSIEAQLAAQDSLYLMDHFDALIDEMVSAKYSGIAPHASAPSWYAPNGGMIKGTGTYIEVEAQFYNVKDTETLYNKRNDSDAAMVFIRGLIGAALPNNFGLILLIQDLCNMINSDFFWNNIDIGKEGCYVYAVYDTLEMRTTTVVIGWDPPYMQLSSIIKVTDHYVNPY